MARLAWIAKALAGEIHDSLAQFFTGIAMQLGAAKEVITSKLRDFKHPNMDMDIWIGLFSETILLYCGCIIVNCH